MQFQESSILDHFLDYWFKIPLKKMDSSLYLMIKIPFGQIAIPKKYTTYWKGKIRKYIQKRGIYYQNKLWKFLPLRNPHQWKRLNQLILHANKKLCQYLYNHYIANQRIEDHESYLLARSIQRKVFMLYGKRDYEKFPKLKINRRRI